MKFMLDTNICIYLMRRQPPQVVARFQAARVGDIVMSAVTHAELSHGVQRYGGAVRDQAASSLNQLARLVPVLSFGLDASAQYGILAAAIRDRRRDALDRLIAAHAIAAGAILLTNNEADFRDYPGLTVENWVNMT
jgi:tRNA(fMet)-specific endonuclease VapC